MRAAFKSIDLAPLLGYPMGGYEERTHGAEGVHDPVTGSVLLLDDGHQKAAILSVDVMALDAAVLEEAGRKVEKDSSIRRENIILSPTVTHSSIDGTSINGIMEKIDGICFPEEQMVFYRQLTDKIAELILSADRELQEARLGYGVSACNGLGTNRNDVNGYYNQKVYLLKVEDPEGNLICLVVSHACMPTVLDSSNYLFSADYIGAFRQTMEAVLHKKRVMFLQGIVGNASCRHTKKACTFQEAKRLSNHLAAAVIDKMDEIQVTEQLCIQSFCREVKLPVKTYESEEEICAEIHKYKEKLDDLEGKEIEQSEKRTMELALYGAERKLRAKRGNIHLLQEISVRIQYLNLGFCSMAAMPPCTFGEIGRDVCAWSKNPCFTVSSYDHVGYIVSREGFMMDCYERNFSYFDDRAHGILVEAFRDIMSS